MMSRQSSDESSTGSGQDARDGGEFSFFRVDRAHRPGEKIPQKPAAVVRVASPARSVAATTTGATQRLDTWIQRESRPTSRRRTITPAPSTETAFERLVDGLLQHPDWHHGIVQFADCIWNNSAGHATPRTLLVSLTDELDGARIALATARALAESVGQVLLVDGDQQRKSLSLLLHDLDGRTERERLDASNAPRPLFARRLWFWPAHVPFAGRLAAFEPEAGNVRFDATVVNAGPWPVAELSHYTSVVDTVFAIVGCGSSRRRRYQDFQRQLQRTGRQLDGCIALQ